MLVALSAELGTRKHTQNQEAFISCLFCFVFLNNLLVHCEEIGGRLTWASLRQRQEQQLCLFLSQENQRVSAVFSCVQTTVRLAAASVNIWDFQRGRRCWCMQLRMGRIKNNTTESALKRKFSSGGENPLLRQRAEPFCVVPACLAFQLVLLQVNEVWQRKPTVTSWRKVMLPHVLNLPVWCLPGFSASSATSKWSMAEKANCH